MIEGTIRTIDPSSRTAVVLADDGRELLLAFPAEAVIEVSEPETMGLMGGVLGDLQLGYRVQVEVADAPVDGRYACTALVCLS